MLVNLLCRGHIITVKVHRDGDPIVNIILFPVNLLCRGHIVTVKVNHDGVRTDNIRAFVALLALAFDVWAFHGAGIGRARGTFSEAIVIRKRAVGAVEARVWPRVRAGKAT